MGDLSENADYISAKEEQGFLEGRIQELEFILKHATIIDNNSEYSDVVEIGTTITVQEGDFPPEVYHMVGTAEADPLNGRISNESPIGKALMGKKAGSTLKINTPAGELQLKILEIN
jgi:transcription elongation factor GreA